MVSPLMAYQSFGLSAPLHLCQNINSAQNHEYLPSDVEEEASFGSHTSSKKYLTRTPNHQLFPPFTLGVYTSSHTSSFRVIQVFNEGRVVFRHYHHVIICSVHLQNLWKEEVVTQNVCIYIARSLGD